MYNLIIKMFTDSNSLQLHQAICEYLNQEGVEAYVSPVNNSEEWWGEEFTYIKIPGNPEYPHMFRNPEEFTVEVDGGTIVLHRTRDRPHAPPGIRYQNLRNYDLADPTSLTQLVADIKQWLNEPS